MLQWFNKQANSDPSPEVQEYSSENSSVADSALTENDHEFLFNQLLDGVAHGWHLGRIIKFFNNLQPRSTPSHWIAWLEKFEQKIVYVADPAQRRVGAIMMRFGELTQSHDELKQLGLAFHRIGKKLLIGNTAELIVEYDGLDRIVEESKQPDTEIRDRQKISSTTSTSEVEIADGVDNTTEDTDFVVEAEFADFMLEEDMVEADLQPASSQENTANTEDFLASEIDPELDTTVNEEIVNRENEPEITTEQTTQNYALTADLSDSTENTTTDEPRESNSGSIESLAALTEQLTVLQDAELEPEITDTEEFIDGDRQAALFEDNESEIETDFTEQPTQILDSTTDSVTNAPSKPRETTTAASPTSNDSIESLAALTEQLTVLQDAEPEPKSESADFSPDNPDSELTLVAPDTVKPDPSTPLSVASFIEAAKALVPQQKNKTIPLTWEEFIVVLEQDETLAQQVAQHLQITSTNPHDIVEATVNRLNQKQSTQLSPATIELVESWFNLGLKQASAEDFQGAIVSWEKALELNPNLSEAWHNRGSALGRLAKYEEAIHSFNRAINLAPKRYQAWNDRAHALYHIKKWEQAIESWDKAISLMSDNYQFWYNRGCALEQLQRYDESISSYEKTLEIKPDFQPARSRYINLVTERSSSSPN